MPRKEQSHSLSTQNEMIGLSVCTAEADSDTLATSRQGQVVTQCLLLLGKVL